jgi:hypothetical protein
MLPYEECQTVFSCVFRDAWDLIDWQGIAVAICFWVAAMVIAYVRGKRRQVRRILLGAWNGSLITLAGIGLFLIGVTLIYSPWERYKALKAYTMKRDTTIEQQNKKIQQLEALRQALETKLKEQPKVIYRDKQAFSGAGDAELARLRTELDNREKRKTIRTEISKLLDEGNALRYALLVKEERADLADKAEAWNTKTYNYLRSIDPSYASRFSASTGLSYSYTDVPKLNQIVVNNVRSRLATLTTILGELRD